MKVFLQSPLAVLFLTLALYEIFFLVFNKFDRVAWLAPVAWTIGALIAVLQLSQISYATYFDGVKFLHFLLGPATVALAVPLYENRAKLFEQWRDRSCDLRRLAYRHHLRIFPSPCAWGILCRRPLACAQIGNDSYCHGAFRKNRGHTKFNFGNRRGDGFIRGNCPNFALSMVRHSFGDESRTGAGDFGPRIWHCPRVLGKRRNWRVCGASNRVEWFNNGGSSAVDASNRRLG